MAMSADYKSKCAVGNISILAKNSGVGREPPNIYENIHQTNAYNFFSIIDSI